MFISDISQCISKHEIRYVGESLRTKMSVYFALTLFSFYLPIIIAKLQIGLKYF